jgi:hypothetical protein
VYFKAQTVFVNKTFDEQTVSSLIGAEFEGTIKKLKIEPYENTIEETCEIIEMKHRLEHVYLSLEIEEQGGRKKYLLTALSTFSTLLKEFTNSW